MVDYTIKENYITPPELNLFRLNYPHEDIAILIDFNYNYEINNFINKNNFNSYIKNNIICITNGHYTINKNKELIIFSGYIFKDQTLIMTSEEFNRTKLPCF